MLTDRDNTAIAGLSMGGNQTLQVGIPHLDQFGYIGVYSSGLLGAFPGLGGGRRGAAPPAAPSAAAPAAAPAAAAPPPPRRLRHGADRRGLGKGKRRDARQRELKKGLKVFWFATGKDDFLLTTTNATVELFKKHGFNAGVQGNGRRPHVDQLARLPERVRADAVPVIADTRSRPCRTADYGHGQHGQHGLKRGSTDEMVVPHSDSARAGRCDRAATPRLRRASSSAQTSRASAAGRPRSQLSTEDQHEQPAEIARGRTLSPATAALGARQQRPRVSLA